MELSRSTKPNKTQRERNITVQQIEENSGSTRN
jgi:hypothetical protein